MGVRHFGFRLRCRFLLWHSSLVPKRATTPKTPMSSIDYLWPGVVLAGLVLLVAFLAMLGTYFESLRKKSSKPGDPARDKHSE